MRLVALVVAAAVLAGCAAPPPQEPPGAPEPRAAPRSFGAPVQTPVACQHTCYEPSVALDPAGRLFVTDASSGEIGVSADGGATWTTLAPPPVPDGPIAGGQSDALLQVSPDGRLYYSALVTRNVPGVANLLEGLQVAYSEDGGATWAVDTYLRAIDEPRPVLSPDRQWLGFGEGDVVWLTYNQAPSGIWIARSDDGGKTFGGWTRAAPLEGRAPSIGQSGPPVVTADGAVHVPACRGMDFAVWSSPDGATFAADVLPMRCNWFPVLAIAPDGALVATANDGSTVRVSHRHADEDWTEPITWGTGATSSPWPILGEAGALALAWYEDGATATLHVSSGTLDGGPEEDVVVVEDIAGGGQTSANTDFAHAVRFADGRVGVVGSDSSDKAIWFAAQRVEAESVPATP